MKAKGINTYWGGDDELFENGLVRAVELGCISVYMRTELAGAITNISSNILALVDYFDGVQK